MMALNHTALLARLRALHALMRDELHAHLQNTAKEEMSAATEKRAGDTIYRLDSKGEEILLPFCEEWGRETPFLLIAEGLQNAGLPPGWGLFGCESIEDAQFIHICDPIDGTRPLMYDKRSAWLLSGIAPNRGAQTNLSHIEVAMQTELPTTRALYSDTLWAVRGGGARGQTRNLVTGETRASPPRTSGAASIEGGYAMFSKFFLGSKGWLAGLEERVMEEILGAPPDGQPQTFDDQYISTGGQLYELMTGRDRFNADLRPLAHAVLHPGATPRLCAHPYDLCTELIAREAGVLVTDENGAPLAAPLDVNTPISWIGYANAEIKEQIEPALLRLLRERR